MLFADALLDGCFDHVTARKRRIVLASGVAVKGLALAACFVSGTGNRGASLQGAEGISSLGDAQIWSKSTTTSSVRG